VPIFKSPTVAPSAPPEVGGALSPATPPSVQTAVRSIPVVEESLQVTKEVVDRGGYRINKRVETRKELVDELLRTEHVEIERRQLNTELADDAIPQTRQEGDTLIVPVIEEILVTVKRLVLVEEVRITRTHGTHRKTQTFTLRKENIEVERLAAEDPSAVKSS
jgi:uncharacterized protein (TIGR02271 family)